MQDDKNASNDISVEVGDVTRIIIKGRFDYSRQSDFCRSFKDREPTPEYILDLHEVTYIDSSALGALLILREHAGDSEIIIYISHKIKDILGATGFDKLFKIIEL